MGVVGIAAVVVAGAAAAGHAPSAVASSPTPGSVTSVAGHCPGPYG